jgi:hypothetical protein
MQHEAIPCSNLKRRPTMISRFKFSALAAAGALLALVTANAPASADDPTTNFGPVGPSDPILATIGGQRLIAFFVPERGSCAVNAVIWKDAGVEAPYASSRIKVSLRPGEMIQLQSGLRQFVNLLCGADASTLTAVAPAELILTGTPGSN